MDYTKLNEQHNHLHQLAVDGGDLSLWEISKGYYCNYVYRISNRTATDDELQDLFVEYLKAIKLYDPTKSYWLGYWHNYVLNNLRTTILKDRTVQLPRKKGTYVELEQNHTSQLSDYEYEIAFEETEYDNTTDVLRNFLNKVMLHLTKKQKKVLELRYFNDEELTFKEIADKLNITRQTAEDHHNKAIKKMKNYFADNEEVMKFFTRCL